MDQLTLLRRYLCLLRLVSPPFSYPNKQKIINRLKEEGISQGSYRSFERDKRKLHLEYGVDIRFHRIKKGYFLHFDPDEDISDFQQFFRLLERRERMEFLGKSTKVVMANQFLLLEENPYFKGNRHLSVIWEALLKRRVVHFQYQSFYKKGAGKRRTIAPGLILEDRNRWYLVGKELSSGRVKTFGLDRLDNPEIGSEGFEGDPAAAYREQKPHVIGITYEPNNPIQRVVLRFSPNQSPYVKSLPIHSSQKILAESEDGSITIAIEVVMNYELEREILGHGERVKVLEPTELRQQIESRIRQQLAQYDKKDT